MQTLANVDTPNGAYLRHEHQESDLCGFQAERAYFIIVDTRENTSEDACTPQQTLTRYLINNIFILFHGVFDSNFIMR